MLCKTQRWHKKISWPQFDNFSLPNIPLTDKHIGRQTDKYTDGHTLLSVLMDTKQNLPGGLWLRMRWREDLQGNGPRSSLASCWQVPSQMNCLGPANRNGLMTYKTARSQWLGLSSSLQRWLTPLKLHLGALHIGSKLFQTLAYHD